MCEAKRAAFGAADVRPHPLSDPGLREAKRARERSFERSGEPRRVPVSSRDPLAQPDSPDRSPCRRGVWGAGVSPQEIPLTVLEGQRTWPWWEPRSLPNSLRRCCSPAGRAESSARHTSSLPPRALLCLQDGKRYFLGGHTPAPDPPPAGGCGPGESGCASRVPRRHRDPTWLAGSLEARSRARFASRRPGPEAGGPYVSRLQKPLASPRDIRDSRFLGHTQPQGRSLRLAPTPPHSRGGRVGSEATL